MSSLLLFSMSFHVSHLLADSVFSSQSNLGSPGGDARCTFYTILLSVYRIGAIADASLSYFGVKVIDSSVTCHLVFSLSSLRSTSVRAKVIHEHKKKDESWFRTLGPMFLDYWQENGRILTSSTLNNLSCSRERVQWISKRKKENLDSRHSPPIFLELKHENFNFQI